MIVMFVELKAESQYDRTESLKASDWMIVMIVELKAESLNDRTGALRV